MLNVLSNRIQPNCRWGCHEVGGIGQHIVSSDYPWLYVYITSLFFSFLSKSACTKLRAPVNLDSRFVDRIAAEDEESVQTLNRVLFSLLRSGRLQDAKTLLDNVGLSALSAFIFIREFLNSPKLSPLDRFDDNFGLAQSRMHFKQAAKDLIPMVE